MSKRKKGSEYGPSSDEEEDLEEKVKPEEEEDDGVRVWEIGPAGKRVSVNIFKNSVRVDIRETYVDGAGERKPTKRGINLSVAEYRDLAQVLRESGPVNKAVAAEQKKTEK